MSTAEIKQLETQLKSHKKIVRRLEDQQLQLKYEKELLQKNLYIHRLNARLNMEQLKCEKLKNDLKRSRRAS